MLMCDPQRDDVSRVSCPVFRSQVKKESYNQKNKDLMKEQITRDGKAAGFILGCLFSVLCVLEHFRYRLLDTSLLTLNIGTLQAIQV